MKTHQYWDNLGRRPEVSDQKIIPLFQKLCSELAWGAQNWAPSTSYLQIYAWKKPYLEDVLHEQVYLDRLETPETFNFV